jgi:two-component system response regulator
MSRHPVILLVDDDEDFLAVADRAIARAKLQVSVQVARSGVEAMDRLGLRGVAGAEALRPPDLVMVMLDLSMPGVTGWDVLRRIRQSPGTRQVPVVMVSSSDRPDEVQTSYSLGANSFLTKRFDPRGVGRYLAEAARYWIELNQPPPAAGARRDEAPADH